MYYKFYSLFFIIILSSFIGYGQSFSEPDSLKNKSYEELRSEFSKALDTDLVKAKIYSDTYFNRVRSTNDSASISRSYDMKSWLYEFSDKRKIEVLDSAILYGKNVGLQHYPEKLYNKRALAYGQQGDLEKQLRDYLTALEFSKNKNNTAYIYVMKHNIALLKMGLGKNVEAKHLLKECVVFDEFEMLKNKGKWDTIHYLQSLSSLVSSYIQTKGLDSAKMLNQKGLELDFLRNKKKVSIFEINDAILNYHNGQYLFSLNKLNEITKKILMDENVSKYDYKLIYGYTYLARIHKRLNELEKATSYFKRVDSLLHNSNYYLSLQKEIFSELIDYYETKNDYHNQLVYVNRLLRVDSVLNSNYRIVSDKLLREFDTKELVEEKQRIIAKLKKEKADISTTNIIISTFLALSLLGLGYYYYRQDLYRKRFIALLKKTEQTNQKNRDLKSTEVENPSINKEVVNSLLDQLEKFEAEQHYLASNLNIKDLAKRFGSNSSYLSKVVNTFKEKSFSNYINDLRINYAVHRLKKDAVFRKYTVKAIGQEIGFKNPDAFSKAFYKQTGIHPSYFIKEIEKKIDNESIASVEAKS